MGTTGRFELTPRAIQVNWIMTIPSAPQTTVQVLTLTQFCGVTPRLFEALMRRFGTIDAIFRSDRATFLEVDGVKARQAGALVKAPERLAEGEAMVKALADRDIRLLTRFDPDYSPLLNELHDPPPLLYFRGHTPDLDKRTVSVAGTRSAGAEGIELTSRLVKELVKREVQIVSTLRGGIDVAAHLAAAAAGGDSFVVMDRGIDQLDTSEGVPVAIDVIKRGGVISEYSPDVPPDPKTLAETNRLLAGLAQAVVVTEFYSNSERTLDLLRACRDIGKLVFILIDPTKGALSDEPALAQAHECGAIPKDGFERIDDIVKALV
jgi:DNA processing protein